MPRSNHSHHHRRGAAFWPLSAAEIATLTHGRLVAGGEVLGTRVILDSRARPRPHDVFFGLRGARFEGGRFAAEALTAGASIAVVQPEVAAELTASAPAGTAIVAVEEPLAALTALAAEARRAFAGTLVALTGGPGRRSVLELLGLALAGERRVHISPQPNHSPEGVALALLSLDTRAEVAIIECDVSLPGEMALLEEVLRPDHGILTRLDGMDREEIGGRNAMAAQASLLFRRLRAGAWILTLGGEALGRGALATIGARVLTAGGDGQPDFVFTPQRGNQMARIERDGESVRLPLDLLHRRATDPRQLEATALAAAAALLLGAAPAAIETGLERWRAAPTHLIVDLDAIVANYRQIQHHVGNEVAVMAVVKSFGYGLNAERLAHALVPAGVQYLAVAYPDEGVRLRENGITAPILVQNILANEVHKVVRHRLAAQVSDQAQIDCLEAEAERQGSRVAVHLKIDTGMSRAGAFPAEAPKLAQSLAQARWLEFEGLMTHLASADDPASDDDTTQQLRRFEVVYQQLTTAGHTPRWIHAANSAAIHRFPTGRCTMVRAGLGLWGYSRPVAPPRQPPSPIVQRPTLRLVSRIVTIKPVPAGQGVGYGQTYTTPSDGGERTLAVVAIGYGDGYPWSLSNRGWMAVHGQRCPVVGRVCMDVTLLDVTALDHPAQAGDEVVVFGLGQQEPSVLDLAEQAGTIPYEILTRISPRVQRIFRSS